MAQRIQTLALVGLLLAACRQADATVYPPKTADFRGGPTRTGVMAADLTAHPLPAWTFEPGAAVATTPALTSTEAFVATANGDVTAVDLKSGAERWRITTGEGTLTSPVLMNDVLLFGTRAGNVWAARLSDGSAVWKQDVGSAVLGAPTVTQAGIVAVRQSGLLVVLEEATGAVKATVDVGGQVTRSTAAVGAVAFVPVDGGALAAVDLTNGSLKWTSKVATAGGVGSPASDGNMVWTATGLDEDGHGSRAVVGVKAVDGSVVWRYQSPTDAPLYTPAIAQNTAVIVGEDGAILARDAATGAPLWSVSTDSVLEALPIVTSGAVLVAANNSDLRAYRLTDGEQLWSMPIEGVPFSPSALGSEVVIATDLGVVYAFVETSD